MTENDYVNIIKNEEQNVKIAILNIFGEIEGHTKLPQNNKVTSYEKLLPVLAEIENDIEIKGILILINTIGGDVEAGLAISEMIKSTSKPSVSLILGCAHSIGVPIALSSNYSFIVDSAIMMLHPLRVTGTVLGVTQNDIYIERMQDRIIDFIVENSESKEENVRKLMFNTKELIKDIGTVLVGKEAVANKIVDKSGGINDALSCLYDLINCKRNSKM